MSTLLQPRRSVRLEPSAGEPSDVIRSILFGLFAVLFATQVVAASAGLPYSTPLLVGQAVGRDPSSFPSTGEVIGVVSAVAALIMSVRELVRTPQLLAILKEVHGITSDALRARRNPEDSEGSKPTPPEASGDPADERSP